MKAYSEDLRERVLRAVDQGRPRAEVVQVFGVSLATIKRGSPQHLGNTARLLLYKATHVVID